MSHLFISYSHTDDAYVRRLAQVLEQEGFQPWVDDRIDYGTTWTGEVQRRLDECAAFLLIMTPHSFESRWVNNELSRAMRKNKPIFPLLLEGEEPWLAVESIQFLDVRGGRLPDERFYQQLATVAERRKPALPEKVMETRPTQAPEPIPETPPPGIPAKEESKDEAQVTPVSMAVKPEVSEPEKNGEKQAVSMPVVQEKKVREKPEKTRKATTPSKVFSRKGIIATGIILGLAILGTGTWLLLEPLGLVASPQSTRTSTDTRSLIEVDTPPPTTTAGMTSLLPIHLGNADQVEQVMQWGGEVINTMIASPTGNRLAVATSRGVIILDAQTLEVQSTLEYGTSVTAIAFSNAGNLLAVGLPGNSIVLVSFDGSEDQKLSVTADISSLAFDPNDEFLAAGLQDGTISIFSMPDGTLFTTLSEHTGQVTNVVFIVRLKQLASVGRDGNLCLWSMTEWKLNWKKTVDSSILSLATQDASVSLATGSEDGFIRIWSLPEGNLVTTLNALTNKVASLAFTSDGSFLASGTENGKVYLWKPGESDEPVATLEGHHTLQIRGLAFTPDVSSLISAGWDGKVLRWDLETLSPTAENTEFSQPITYLALHPKVDLAYAIQEGAIYIENIVGEKPPVVLKGPPDSFGIEFVDDGEKVMTISSVGILMESETESPVMVVDGFPAEVTSVAFKDQQIAVGFTDATIRWYNEDGSSSFRDWSTGQDKNAVELMEFASWSYLLAASYEDGLLVVWQAGGGGSEEQSKWFEIPGLGAMQAMTFTPDSGVDGFRLLMAGQDGRIRYQDSPGGVDIKTVSIEGVEAGVDRMEFSPDGTLLALGLVDGNIALVNYTDLKVITILEGHTNSISDLLWLPDATMLISSSWDGSIRFWGVEP